MSIFNIFEKKKDKVRNIDTDRILDDTINDLKRNPDACTLTGGMKMKDETTAIYESNPGRQLSEFIKFFYDSDLVDKNYESNVAVLKNKDTDSCTYNEICSILTSIIRGDRFQSGLIYSKFKDGTLLMLLEKLKELSK